MSRKPRAFNFDPFAFSLSKLSGGVSVYHNLNLPVPTLLVGAVFFSGSREEPKGKWGVGHFMEHLPFRGTDAFPNKVALTAPIENLGGVINAWTSHEEIVFLVKTAPEDLPLGLKALTEIIFRARNGKSDFRDEFSAVVEELGDNLSNPAYKTIEEALKRLFRGHPLGHSPLGTAESLKALCLRDVRDFYESRIKNGPFALVVLGNAREDTILGQLEAVFGKVQPPVETRLTVAYKQSRKEEVILERLPYPRTHLFLGGTAFSATDSKNATVAEVFETMLTKGLSSPLFHALREDEGLVYGYNFSYDSWSDAGVVWFSASTKMRNARRIQRIFFETAQGVADDKRRFALAKEMLLKANRLEEWTLFDILNETARCLTRVGKPPSSRQDEEARITAVTHDRVRRFAETYLNEERFLTVILKGQAE